MAVTITVTAQSNQWQASPVTARLIVGGGLTGPDEIAWLTSQGVTDIISAAAELDDTALCVPDHLSFHHIAWADDSTPKPVADFLALVQYTTAREADALSHARPLPVYYVHCAAGAHRGPLAATFWLAAMSGLSGDDAFALIQAARSLAGSFSIPAYRQSCLDALAALAHGKR